MYISYTIAIQAFICLYIRLNRVFDGKFEEEEEKKRLKYSKLSLFICRRRHCKGKYGRLDFIVSHFKDVIDMPKPSTIIYFKIEIIPYIMYETYTYLPSVCFFPQKENIPEHIYTQKTVLS